MNKQPSASVRHKDHQARIVSMFTNKGGVGKTTAVYNLGALIAKHGLKVLLLDADSQCNLSKSFLKFKLYRDRALCPYENKEHKRLIFRKLTQVLLSTTPFSLGGLEHYNLDIQRTVFKPDELLQWAKDKQPGRDFLLYLSAENRWFFYGALGGGVCFSSKRAVRCLSIKQKGTATIDEEAKFRQSKQSLEMIFPVSAQSSSSKIVMSKEEERRQLIFFMLEVMGYDYIEYAATELLNLLDRFQVEFVDPYLSEVTDLSGSGADERAGSDTYYLEYGEWPSDGDEQEDLRQRWRLRHVHCSSTSVGQPDPQRSEREIPISEIKGLEALLNDKTEVDQLDESERLQIRSALREARNRNLYQLLDTNASRMTPDYSYPHAGNTSLLSIKPDQKGKGELLLLPGSADFQLEFDQRFSNATAAIDDDRYASNKKYIYEVNAIIRYLANMHSVDFVLMDLNPSSSNINQILLMTSDVFMSTVNTEEYSDDAMLSLSKIIKKWSGSFAKIYSTKNIKSDYPDIKVPPKFLGLFMQRLHYSGKKFKSLSDKQYFDEIHQIFNAKVVAALVDNKMYPTCGLYHFTANKSGDIVPKRGEEVLGVRSFDRAAKEKFMEGTPVVWLDPDDSKHKRGNLGNILDDFKRVLRGTLGHYVINTPGFSEKARPIFMALFRNLIQKGAFCQVWSAAYGGWRSRLNTEDGFMDRIKYIGESFYRLDFFDMQLLVCHMRKKFTDAATNDGLVSLTPEFKVNPKGVILTDPCKCEKVHNKVVQALFSVRKHWKMQGLSVLLVPFFRGNSWAYFCITINKSASTRSASIVFDDPRGRGYHNPTDDFQESISSEVSRIRELLKQYLGEDSDITDEHDPLDQQRDLANDTDSGVIVYNNIRSRIESAVTGCSFSYSNKLDGPDISAVRRKGWNPSSKSVELARLKLRAWYDAKQRIIFNFFVNVTREFSNKSYGSYTRTFQAEDVRYVKDFLSCFPNSYLGRLNSFFEDNKKRFGYLPSLSLTLSFYQRSCRRHEPAVTAVVAGADFFKDSDTKEVYTQLMGPWLSSKAETCTTTVADSSTSIDQAREMPASRHGVFSPSSSSTSSPKKKRARLRGPK